MKFLHIADCHIGGWQDPKMQLLGLESFRKAIKLAMSENVDFVLLSGDLFNTALPQIDLVKEVVDSIRTLKEAEIPLYLIPGSHDFSPSGKTMLDVLEKAGLCTNVMKTKENHLIFTVDKSGAKITGLFGKKGGLEKSYYESLDFSNLESEQGFKIFMFHTALEEFKPESMKSMDAQSVVSLPKGFDYYAGGHVHYILKKPYGRGFVVFPGALFPNNFKELEEYKCGSAFLYDNGDIRLVKFPLKDVLCFRFNADGKSPEELYDEIARTISDVDANDKIVTLRVEGVLASGKPSDINFKAIFELLDSAYFVAKNISKLKSASFSEIKVESGSVAEVEQTLIDDHASQISVEGIDIEKEKKLTNDLMHVLDKEKNEGEKVADFEKRVFADALKVMGMELEMRRSEINDACNVRLVENDN